MAVQIPLKIRKLTRSGDEEGEYSFHHDATDREYGQLEIRREGSWIQLVPYASRARTRRARTNWAMRKGSMKLKAMSLEVRSMLEYVLNAGLGLRCV